MTASCKLIAIVLLSAAISVAASAAVPPLSIYGALPGFEMASLSPSGARIALVADIGGQRRVVVLEGTSKPLYSTVIGDTKVRGLYWAGEKTLLLRKSDTQELNPFEFTRDQIELFSMLVIPLDGKPAWTVFADSKSITGGVRGFYGVRQRGESFLAYFGGITMEKAGVDRAGANAKILTTTKPDLYEVDLGSHKPRLIASHINGDGSRHWVVGPDGQVSGTLDFFHRDGEWLIRNREGLRIAGGTSLTGGVSLVGLGATPGTLVYAVEDEGGRDLWMEQPMAGGEARRILDAVSVAGTLFDERAQQLIGFTVAGDSPGYRFFEARAQKVIDAVLRAFPGRTVLLQDWNQTFDKLIVRTVGAGDSGAWWAVDIQSGKSTSLGTSYSLQPQDVGAVRMIHYQAADGLEISAVLTLPPGVPEKNLPVVVMPHGGPASRDYPGFDWWAQAFASRGYAVLQPNFRGSTGYSAAFERAGDGEWGRSMQTDLSDGLAALAQAGTVDPRRACIVGASYGGYAALAGVTLQKGVYRCAAAVAGVSDPVRLIDDDIRQSGRDKALTRSLRRQVGTGRDLRDVSPIRFAASADAPIMLVHGKDDTVVDYEQSAAMASALRGAGKPVEFVTLDGEDHWLSRGETRLAMLKAVVGFVEKHNPAGITEAGAQ